jgi:hypothetical protein
LLGEGFAANLSVLGALQRRAGYTNAQAAAMCGVSLRTYRRWRSQANPTPGAVRLLAILAGFVPWDGWDGWEVHQGLLFPPGYSKGGIPPGEFFALVFYRQQVGAYQQANAALTARLEALGAELAQLRGQPQERPQERSALAGAGAGLHLVPAAG